MLKCESLNKVLNGDKTVSYTYFKNDLIDFIKDCMKEINKNTYHYLPRVNITNNSEVLGASIKLNEIEIDESVFKYIYSGKKIHLLDIFHELAHNRQKYLIINGIIDKNLSDIIKEDLLDCYFEINNKEESFYKINYDLDSSEVQADLEAIDLFYSYIAENNINLNLIDLYYLSDLTKDLRKKLKNKKRKYLNEKMKICKIDMYKLFDYIIKNNPEWLDWYPQLKLEYYFDEVVKRRDYKDFDLMQIENESDGYKEYVNFLKKEANKKTIFKIVRG